MIRGEGDGRGGEGRDGVEGVYRCERLLLEKDLLSGWGVWALSDWKLAAVHSHCVRRHAADLRMELFGAISRHISATNCLSHERSI